jgi:hypothetical protein
MQVQLSIAFTENCVYWTYNICGLNHPYPFTTFSFTIYVSSYNFLTSHSHRPVSNNGYTERHIGSSHYVRGCQVSTVMLLFAEILNYNAQYSLSLTPRHQFANRGTGTPNRVMSQTFHTVSNTNGKSLKNSCHSFIWLAFPLHRISEVCLK